ncbi:MAG: hypothetical protein ACI85O_002496, partial [Saprospiraceae bacterium]
NPNSLLTRTLQHNTFSYKKDMKQKRNFEGIVMDTIIPNTNIAIERAIVLEELCNEQFHKVSSKISLHFSPSFSSRITSFGR